MTDAPLGGDLAGTRVFVTGAHGFLGRAVRARLEAEPVDAVITPSHRELELRDLAAVETAFRAARPDIVIHLAARVGGIGANQTHPGTFWRDNTLLGVNVLEGARVSRARRVVVVGTVCAYPKDTPVPFSEDALWSGFPEETNAPYGVAKRALATGLAAYRAQFGIGGAYLLPANLYGPHDDFDLETSHVIPAMIRKCIEAKDRGDDTVELWGTGTPSREFLFVDDAAEAVVRAAAQIDDPTPMNVGTGREVKLKDLAGLIASATGFTGRFTWNAERPDGQLRRSLDVTQARARLGFEPAVSLEDGLARTVAWYRQDRA